MIHLMKHFIWINYTQNHFSKRLFLFTKMIFYQQLMKTQHKTQHSTSFRIDNSVALTNMWQTSYYLPFFSQVLNKTYEKLVVKRQTIVVSANKRQLALFIWFVTNCFCSSVLLFLLLCHSPSHNHNKRQRSTINTSNMIPSGLLGTNAFSR